MKKVWLLITVLLLVGCGSSTTVSNVSESQPGSGGIIEVGPETPTGSVVVNISDNGTKTDAAAPAATRVRLVISNSGLRFSGATTTYKVIVDGAIVPSITGLAFPVANGYVFEVVTYIPQAVQPGGTPTVNRMLKYAKASNVSITRSGGEVNLTLAAIEANFTLPNPTYSGETLNLTAQLQQPTPLQTRWNLVLSASPIINALHSTTPTHSEKAPIVLTAGTVYAQGEFYINKSLLDATGTLTILDSTNTANSVTHTAENYLDWTFNYPNPEFGDPDVSAPLNLVGVTIPIN